MKNFKQRLLVLWLFLCVMPLFGQTYSTGAILDPVRYEQADAKPVLLSRSYSSVPPSVSLKRYSPLPESQSPFGTCVGWATAFATRTISESIVLNRTDQRLNSSNAFSPVFVYIGHYLSMRKTPTGQEGANIGEVLDYMRKEGAVKRPSFELDYMKKERAVERLSSESKPRLSIPFSGYNTLQRYAISDYVRLFSNPRGVPGTISERVLPVKKSLSEGKPVIIGMNTPDSFYRARNIWQPTESPIGKYDGHAMCVVGYDDDKEGGAFEIQNSWGTGWGNGGYVWIRYEDFANWVDEAYEIIENLSIYKNSVNYAASIKIEVYNNSEGMPVSYDRQGFYKTRTSYPSGTDFRFLMTNKHPAYVYAFSADSSTTDTERIFPLRGVSPVLDYNDSTIAWPGEYDWIRLNNVTGTDYLVVLYSKEALDIGAIERRFANERGTFPERVARAVGLNFIPYGDVQYNGNTMEFSAKSFNQKAVFGLLLAIDHR
ncbi:MAG: C1 family peptidase [Treponema sp.]|jgi:hypothetical protein|nr:C1 family peptidase [Treponema sp.]